VKDLAPAIFVSHGAPTMYLDPTPTHEFLIALGKALDRPRAILCVSAHWEAARPTTSASPHPDTIHDLGGFPDELYRVSYALQGTPPWPNGWPNCWAAPSCWPAPTPLAG
jgi:4,5-DOPA dioxygenase extradiol